MARRLISYTNWTLLTLFLLANLVLLQVIAYRQEIRWDFTESSRQTLSKQSRDVLAVLRVPLNATAFYGEAAGGSKSVKHLFREYALASPQFHYRFVNPAKNPDLVQRYQIKSHGTVVLEYEGRRINIHGADEERITNGIYRLFNSRQSTVYFIEGHGEKGISRGADLLWQSLEEEGYRVAGLSLTKAAHVPDDANCVVIAGPRADFFKDEIALLDSYLSRGGNLAVFIDPFQDGGLDGLLQSHGLLVPDLSIVDKTAKLPGGGILFPTVSKYNPHSITRHLSQMTFYPVVNPIEVVDPIPDNLRIDPLVQSEISSWGESDRQSMIDEKSEFDPKTDRPGPLHIAIAVEHFLEDIGKTSRLVVFGDSDFLSDSYLFMAGNRDLLLNSLAWVAEQEDLISVRSRDPEFTPIIISERKQRAITWISLLLLPGVAIGSGLMVLWRWKRK